MSDLISRQAAIDALCKQCTVDRPETCSTIQKGDKWCEEVYTLLKLPSAQPEITQCKDCGHFHYDMPYVIQGVPVLGHEVCDFWGDGCKTSENGYCSFAERREDERPES